MKQTTTNLFESLVIDVYPRNAAIVDFGIDTSEHYAALQRLVKKHGVPATELDAVSCDGPKITALVRKFEPEGDIVFSTSWDELGPEM